MTPERLYQSDYVDTGQVDLPVGVVIPAVDAVGGSFSNCDIRPRLLDKKSGRFRLIDSGSQITATVRSPEDKLDPTMRLVAVNGSKIDTYGVKQIEVKLGRKSYQVEAVVCDIQQDILGMDFIKKYKLGLEWNEAQSELYLVDKKADIKAKLQMVTVPADLQRVEFMENYSSGANPGRGKLSNEAVAFQVSCVKKLSESESSGSKESSEELLKLHEPFYADLKEVSSAHECQLRQGGACPWGLASDRDR